MTTYPPPVLRGLGRFARAVEQAAPQPHNVFGLGGELADFARRDRRKLVAWNHAALIPGRDGNEWRMDDYGCRIRFSDYGDRESDFGWEIDHIVPLARGGLDIDSNLRALYWAVNASRGL